MKEIVIPCLLVAQSGETTILKPKADLNSIQCYLLNNDDTLSDIDFIQSETATNKTFCIIQNNEELIFVPPTLNERKFLIKYCREVDGDFDLSNGKPYISWMSDRLHMLYKIK